MQHESFKILHKEIVYKGYCQVELYTLQNRLFSGAFSEPYQREIVRRYNAVAALPYDPVQNKIVLIEQFRAPAIFQEQKSPWLLELVAGVTDKANESHENLIRREIMEEAGLECRRLIPITTFLASPGGSSEEVTIFCAEVDAAKAPRFCGLSEENEDIKIHLFEPEETFAMVKNGTINNGSAIIALQWLELNFAKVRQKWLEPV